ncbi:hypothetical protein HK104_005652 [Borealophlyctis nickersoniae]|nr:hypothetical protein HK104_005652 [Borealophlyctis nickersoniae]
MAYVGSKISLISKSDIRYVGILHNINQQESSVALEQVTSFGTEGRKGNPLEEIPASDKVFPYIVFRGSDIKDLHVVTAPAQPAVAPPPQVPDDPAIIGAQSQAPTPPGFNAYGGGPMMPPMMNQGMAPQPFGMPPGMNPYMMQQPMGFQQQNQHRPPQPGPGYWPPPPQQGFPNVPQQNMVPPPVQNGNMPMPIGSVPSGNIPPQPLSSTGTPSNGASMAPSAPLRPPASDTPTTGDLTKKMDSMQLKDKPAVVPPKDMVGTKPAAPVKEKPAQGRKEEKSEEKAVPSAKANGRAMRPVQPQPPHYTAVPQAGQLKPIDVTKTTGKDHGAADQRSPVTPKSGQAVAAPAQAAGSGSVGVDDQAKPDVNTANINGQPEQQARLPGTGAHLMQNNRRGAGRPNRRGYPNNYRNNRIVVPDSDFDFESANAKFNKTELAKDGEKSPTADGPAEPEELSDDEPESPSGFYKKSSFFDDISCESKDRAEGADRRGSMQADQDTDVEGTADTTAEVAVAVTMDGVATTGTEVGTVEVTVEATTMDMVEALVEKAEIKGKAVMSGKMARKEEAVVTSAGVVTG